MNALKGDDPQSLRLSLNGNPFTLRMMLPDGHFGSLILFAAALGSGKCLLDIFGDDIRLSEWIGELTSDAIGDLGDEFPAWEQLLRQAAVLGNQDAAAARRLIFHQFYRSASAWKRLALDRKFAGDEHFEMARADVIAEEERKAMISSDEIRTPEPKKKTKPGEGGL